MTEPPAGRVGRAAYLLGMAGLLPQLLATGLLLFGRLGDPEAFSAIAGAVIVFAIAYPLIILSFLGGMWWSFAMRRTVGQGRLAALATVPSLFAIASAAFFVGVSLAGSAPPIAWYLVTVGSTIMATLLVDHHLVSMGNAPAGWMRLRVPLSLGLGGLTILTGAIVGTPVTHY